MKTSKKLINAIFVTDIIVRDHCHITGKYRGPAHQDCNLNFQLTDKIPVIFLNLRGYDSHFIMQKIGQIAKNHTYKNKKGEELQMNINAIPNNIEKYMAFMLGNNLTFIDSFQFIISSLDKFMIIWTALKSLIKLNYQKKKNFTAF